MGNGTQARAIAVVARSVRSLWLGSLATLRCADGLGVKDDIRIASSPEAGQRHGQRSDQAALFFQVHQRHSNR